jgi:hypothetical protein
MAINPYELKRRAFGYHRPGKGGGGGPSNQTVSQTSIPEYAKPYVENLLGKSEALTNTPYQQYTGDRVAGLDPLQTAAQQGLGGISGSGMIGQSAAGTGGAMLSAAELASTQAGGFTGATAQGYMSPYIQNVLDVQKRELGRDAAIATTQRNAQATQAGAFGGARQAITDAEAERNLMQRQADVQAQGLQGAYDRAQSAYFTDQDQTNQARQAGISSLLSGAGQLSNLGSQVIGMQDTLGKDNAALAQRELDAQYQDFADQQNWNYKQLGFMSDILRGSANLTQSSNSVYQAPPSTAAQLASLGTAAAGLSKLKKGGRVRSGLAELALHQM